MNNRTARLPCFPSEVWLTVFEWSTFVPHELDSHASDPFAYPGPPSQEQIQESIHQSLLTRRRLVLVCKSWNHLATRFLYQTIPIFHPKTPELLLRSLSDYTADPSSSDVTRMNPEFSWTIRLDIALRRWVCLSWHDFANLLRRLPNLQIIVLRWRWPTLVRSGQILSFFDVSAEVSTLALRVLDALSNDLYDRRVMSNLPSTIVDQPLRVFNIRLPRSTPQMVLNTTFNIPGVERLDVPWAVLKSCTAGKWPPSLYHISLQTSVSAISDIYGGIASDCACNITSLEIEDNICEELDFTRNFFAQFFCEIINIFPNLLLLIFSFKYMACLSAIKYLPPIEKLGLRWHTLNGCSKKWSKEVCEMLSRLVEETTTLRVIRFLNKPAYEDLKKHHAGSLRVFHKYSKKYIAKRGVRFEDCTGRLFHDVDAPSPEPSAEALARNPISLST